MAEYQSRISGVQLLAVIKEACRNLEVPRRDFTSTVEALATVSRVGRKCDNNLSREYSWGSKG